MAGSGEERIVSDSDFSRIVKLIKENSFSGEEISRLLDILNSKTDKLKKQESETGNGKDSQTVLRTAEVPSVPSQEKNQNFPRAGTVKFHENSDIPTKVDASPIDIARAYMASCTSGGGTSRQKSMSKYDQAQQRNFSSGKAFSPSPAPKPLICWPGAVLHDHSTPQDQKRRQGIHGIMKSPYARPTLSKSTSKLSVSGRYENPSSPFQQSQASSYMQENFFGENVGDHGSTGPIRRVRSRFASEFRPRVSIFSGSDKQVSSRGIVPQTSEGSLPGNRKNVERDKALGARVYSGENASAISDMDAAYTKLSSSQAIRTILEHLDREKPTPKEKEAELQLTTSWKTPFVPRETNMMHVENGSSIHIKEPASNLHSGISDGKDIKSKLISASINDTSEAKDAGKGKDIASEADNGISTLLHVADLKPSFATSKGSFSLDKSGNKANSIFSKPIFGNGQTQDTRMVAADSELSKNHITKPSLPSLAISKPTFGASSPGNLPTFTFPVSASPSILSDLPTPSIFPSSSIATGSAPYPMVPSYTFGTNSSTPRLVFSFPSASSTSTTQDDSDPTFKFGSGNKNTRLSFASLGKDAVCC